jgi:hypothetical protein
MGRFNAFVLVAVLLVWTQVALAQTQMVAVTGSGTWGEGTLASPFSAAGESFSFSFDIADPILGTAFANGLNTVDVTDFSYDLNGKTVQDALSSVSFYDTATLGLFDLVLANGQVVSAYGADIGSTGTLDLGKFSATYATNDGAGTGSGVVQVTAVPEPASAAVVLGGLVCLGAARRRAKRRV